MKAKKYIFLILGLTLVLLACNRNAQISENSETSLESIPDYTEEILEPLKYSNWFSKEAQHLKKTASNEKLKFELLYLSPEYSALMELQGMKPNPQEWDTMVNNYNGITQFKLMVSANGFNDEFIKMDKPESGAYEERIKYYAFDMQKDIYSIIDNKDTVDCSMFHFERSYGISPVSTFLIGFTNLNYNDKIKIVINEKVFSKKELEFNYSQEEIKNVPQLKPF